MDTPAVTIVVRLGGQSGNSVCRRCNRTWDPSSVVVSGVGLMVVYTVCVAFEPVVSTNSLLVEVLGGTTLSLGSRTAVPIVF